MSACIDLRGVRCTLAGRTVLDIERLVVGEGERIALDVAKGDTVLYSKYGGTEIKVDGEDLLVLRESDVLAKVES